MVPSSPVSQRMIWMPLLPAPVMVLRAADAVAAAAEKLAIDDPHRVAVLEVDEPVGVAERALAAVEHQA
jgi:hypothetical protein